MYINIQFGEQGFEIKIGDRIGQFILQRINTRSTIEADGFEGTRRGNKGFGGTKSDSNHKESNQDQVQPVESEINQYNTVNELLDTIEVYISESEQIFNENDNSK